MTRKQQRAICAVFGPLSRIEAAAKYRVLVRVLNRLRAQMLVDAISHDEHRFRVAGVLVMR